MKYRIAELIDLAALQSLMESFYRATGINHALIDNDSHVLTAVGWAPLCTDFHRVNPKTCERCLESDRYILKHLHDGPYAGYNCPNGLVDYATPIIIDSQHLANIFTGQFFHEAPDLQFFHRQAEEFGFDPAAYLAAVEQVPIVPRERMPEIMAFLVGLAQLLAQQGLTRLRQQEAERELRQLNDELAERVEKKTEELSYRNGELADIITQHQRTEAALRQEKRISDDIINSLPGVFYMLDGQGGFVRWNHRFSQVSGYSDDEIASMNALQFFDKQEGPVVQARIAEVFERGESSVEARLRTKGGAKHPYLFSGHRTLFDGRPYLVGLGVDIAKRKALEAELERQVREDSLTGVATRRYFLQISEQELARSRRYGSPLSFLMLDIDQFKSINDAYGHGVGDRVLQCLAEVCRQTLRMVDVAGRVGGDEFAVILPETGIAQARDAAERLRRAVAGISLTLEGGAPLRFTTSICITTLTSRDNDLDELLRQADEALYRAKREGRDRVAVFPET